LTLFTSVYDVNAEENGGYTIEGALNEHQIDKNVSYFYLDEQPGIQDQIKVKLINDSATEKTLCKSNQHKYKFKRFSGLYRCTKRS